MRTTQLRIVLVLGLVGTATAAAQPKQAARKPAPRTGSVPMKSVPCAMDNLELSVVDDSPVVCWETGCMKLDVLRGEASAVPKPPAPKRWLSAVGEIKGDSVCAGATCKPFGKKLAAAVAGVRASAAESEADAPVISATADLKAVAIPSGSGPAQIWSVAQDKPLKLKAPPSKGEVFDVIAAGNLFAVDWRACAGPCAELRFVDSSGRNKGSGGTGGGPVFQLDAKRFVAVSEYARVQVYDIAKGKLLGTLELNGQPGRVDAVRIDENTLAVMFESSMSSMDVALVNAFEKMTPTSEVSMRLPSCDQ